MKLTYIFTLLLLFFCVSLAHPVELESRGECRIPYFGKIHATASAGKALIGGSSAQVKAGFAKLFYQLATHKECFTTGTHFSENSVIHGGKTLHFGFTVEEVKDGILWDDISGMVMSARDKIISLIDTELEFGDIYNYVDSYITTSGHDLDIVLNYWSD